jgi:hypothetical protein
LVEVEKRRSGKKMTRKDSPMNNFDASRLMNHSIVVLRVLGWAWRWAEWWVEYESNWEPLLEPGQKEKDLTKKELKIVDSTQESRCDDARKCRLAAVGAALRHRCYDTDEGFDNESFDRAIRAVLNTPSLVGPFEKVEIDFLAEWLGRAYRSKSYLLGLGDDKVPVAKDVFCLHIDDKTPKYELGDRPIPGKKQLRDGKIFETDVNEPDDYLKPEVGEHGELLKVAPLKIKKKPVKCKKDPEEPNKDGKRSREAEDMSEASEPPKKRGRQPKPKDVVQSSLGEKRSSVASLVPSAVKKRDRPPKRHESTPAATKKRGVKKKLRLLEASIVFEELKSPDGTLRRCRRGRPPKIWELPVVLRVGGEYFYPDRNTGKIAKRESFADDATIEESSGLENEMKEEKAGDMTSSSDKTASNAETDVENEGEQDGVNLSSEETKSATDTNVENQDEEDNVEHALDKPKGIAILDSDSPEASPKDSKDAKQSIVEGDERVKKDSAESSSPSQDDASVVKPEAVIEEETAQAKETAEVGPTPDPEKAEGKPEASSQETGNASGAGVASESKKGDAGVKMSEGEEPAEEKAGPKKEDGESNDTPTDEAAPAPASSPKKRLGRPPRSPGRPARSPGRPARSPGRPARSPGTFGRSPNSPEKVAKAPKSPGKVGRPRKSPEQDTKSEGSTAVASRPKRSTKHFTPFSVSSFIETQNERQRRSSRKSPHRRMSLKEDESSSEEEFKAEESGEENKEVVDSKPSKTKRGRPGRSPGKPRKEDQPMKKPRLARSASKKARAEIEAPFYEENLPLSSSDSYHVSSDDDEDDESDEALEMDEVVEMDEVDQNNDDGSTAEGDPSGRYPQRSSCGKTEESDPEDDLPLSVLIESAKNSPCPETPKKGGRPRKHPEPDAKSAGQTSDEDIDNSGERKDGRAQKRANRWRPAKSEDDDEKYGDKGISSNASDAAADESDENLDEDSARKIPKREQAEGAVNSKDDENVDASDSKKQKGKGGEPVSQGVKDSTVENSEAKGPRESDCVADIEKGEANGAANDKRGDSKSSKGDQVGSAQGEDKADHRKGDSNQNASISSKHGAKAKTRRGKRDKSKREDEEVAQNNSKIGNKDSDEKSERGEQAEGGLNPKGGGEGGTSDGADTDADSQSQMPDASGAKEPSQDEKSKSKPMSELSEKVGVDETPGGSKQSTSSERHVGGKKEAKEKAQDAEAELAGRAKGNALKSKEVELEEAATPDEPEKASKKGRSRHRRGSRSSRRGH